MNVESVKEKLSDSAVSGSTEKRIKELEDALNGQNAKYEADLKQ